MQEKIDKIFDFWALSDKLKRIKRWKGVKRMIPKETSADHSWQVAAMTFLAIEGFNIKIDEQKCLKLALVHDLAEALADDVDAVLIHTKEASQDEKDKKEREAILSITKALPAKSSKEIKNLWEEYYERKTREAKFVHAIDKLESIVHLNYMGRKCFHDHPDFMATYCHKAVRDFPELKSLHYVLQKNLKEGFVKNGWKWKSEYNGEEVSKNLENKAKSIVSFLQFGQKLKITKRFSTVKEMPEKESAADHSWDLALLSFIVADELEFEVDVLKSIKLSLFHDIAEAVTGDIDYTYIYDGAVSKATKRQEEIKAVKIIASALSGKLKKEILDLWNEYDEAKTEEARFIKALDKIEGINHMLVLGSTCFDRPELIAPYPNAAVRKYQALIPLLMELHRRLMPEFEKCRWEWREEYEEYDFGHLTLDKEGANGTIGQ